MPINSTDPLALCKALVALPTITPQAKPAFDWLEPVLTDIGFSCHRITFEEDGTPPVENMVAFLGNADKSTQNDKASGQHLCFAGHVDVVPVGALDQWQTPPFEPHEREGILYGRGTSDMKGAIAAFIAAVAEYGRPKQGMISLLLTGDEEGPAINGTHKVLAWLADKGHKIDHALVGEPTNPDHLGEMIKIGRRGSLSAHIKVNGKQGHVAYPHLADNPLHTLSAISASLLAERLDEGSEHFQPSNLQITSVETDNKADNVIPASAIIRLNIRFNDKHTAQSLMKWIEDKVHAVTKNVEISFYSNAESFISPADNILIPLLQEAINEVTGRTAEASTTGGTSDARFISQYAPVVEFGLINKTIHQIDENTPINAVYDLKKIYLGVLERYFDR